MMIITITYPPTPAVAGERLERTNFCEAIRKDMLGLLGVQKATFGSLGCRPRARSVPHCHGVLVLRQRP